MIKGAVSAFAAVTAAIVGLVPAAFGLPAGGPASASTPSARTTPAAVAGLAAAKEVAGTGITGTLTQLASAPDGTIYGGDDRGVWRLEADGWRLIRPVDYAPNPGNNILEAQFSKWPGAMRVIPRKSAPAGYVIVAADGTGSDVVRSDDAGQSWDTISVINSANPNTARGVDSLCYAPVTPGGDPTQWATTLFALIGNGVFTSSDAGATWRLRLPSSDPDLDPTWPFDCDMGFGSTLAMRDPKSGNAIIGGAQTFEILRGGVFTDVDTFVCSDASSIEGRAAISGTSVVVLSDTGCYATGTYDPQSDSFGAWVEKRVTGVGSMGMMATGYYEQPTGVTMYGDTAYFATETGVFAYSVSQDRWFNASRGIPMRSRSPVPTYRSGSWIIAGGYQGGVNALGLFSSSDDGATFSRMKGLPTDLEMRYLGQVSETEAYILDLDQAMGTTDVYRTVDGGATWAKSNPSPFTWMDVLGMTTESRAVYIVAFDRALNDCCRLELSVQVSTTSGASFEPIDSTACSFGDPLELDNLTMSPRPGGGVVILHHTRGDSNVKGCTLTGPESAPSPVSFTGGARSAGVSLVTYRDSQLWAYPYDGGRALVSVDGSVWSECTTRDDMDLPAGIQSITRDSASSLVGVAIDATNGSRIIRSTDGCGWDTGATDLSDSQADMTSMVLPEDGEFVDSRDDPSEVIVTGARASSRASSARILKLRAIGPGSKGSIVKSVRFGPAPGAPGKRKAIVVAGKITLQLTAPKSGGGGVKGYTATCTAPRKPARTATSATTTIVISRLAPKTTYTCKVTANDAAGPGATLTWSGLKTP